MAKKSRKNFSAEFRLETAQLVVNHGYTHERSSKDMNVVFSTIGKWVKQLKEERRGKNNVNVAAAIAKSCRHDLPDRSRP